MTRAINTAAAGSPFPSFNHEQQWRIISVHSTSYITLGMTNPSDTGNIDNPGKTTAGGFRGCINKRRYTAGATTASTTFGVRNSTAAEEVYARTSVSAASGGFDLFGRVGMATIKSDQRWFFGVLASTSAMTGTADPSSLTNIMGFAKDSADSNLQFIYNDGSGTATKVDLLSAFAFAAGNFYDCYVSVAAGGTTINYKIVDLRSGAIYTGSATSDLPATDTALYWQLWGSNGPTGGTACSTEFNTIAWRYPATTYV